MRILLHAVVLASLWSVQAAYPQDSGEQIQFSAEEDSVRDPVPIPPEVKAILKLDHLVQSVLANANITAENLPTDWFSASAIHLSSKATADLIVVAEPPLAGGNVVTFWVFQKWSGGYTLVLTAPAHDLKILHHRTGNYRDIELVSMTASSISTILCRFDGKQYATYRSISKSIQ